jgi:hypothetical protein
MAVSNLSQEICPFRLTFEVFPLDYGYYVCGPIMTLFIVVGLVGNLICLFVLFSSRPKPVVTYYTVPLCISDCFVLLGSFFMINLPHLLYGRIKTYGPYVYLYPYTSLFSNFAYTACVWLIVLLSVERYFALCHPLKHKIYDAKTRSIWISILCLVAAFIYNIPRFFEITTFDCYLTQTQETMSFLEEAPFRKYKSYWFVYRVVLGSLLFSFGPFALLCYLSIRMWKEVKSTNMITFRKRPSQEVEQRDEHSTLLPQQKANGVQKKQLELSPSTKSVNIGSFRTRSVSVDKQREALAHTLLCVILKFLICHLLPAIIDLCETFMDEKQFYQPLIENIVDTSTLFVVANSSLNIFIYAGCSQEFRRRIFSACAFRKFKQTNEASTSRVQSCVSLLRRESSLKVTPAHV